MEDNYFIHPQRLPKNVDGPFYTLGVLHQGDEDQATWHGNCMACEAPEAEAPELLALLNENNTDTYFVRQPCSTEELSQACMALRVCCVDALRYGGCDPAIIKELHNDPTFCDYLLAEDGSLVLAVDDNGELLPFAQKIAAQRRAQYQHEWRKRNKKWWQFWL